MPADRSNPLAAALQSARILVVDDEVISRNVIVAQLRHEGYEIVTAASGEEALDQVGHQHPDLILLDVTMSGISGFDVVEILKSDARTAAIPVIMLTALSDGESRITALSNGAEEILTKPIARSELLMRVRNLLKLKKLQDGLADYNSLLENRVAEGTMALEDANLQLTAAHEHLLQSEKMAAIGQLAAGVAHEINNPIGFVGSNLRTLKDYIAALLELVSVYEQGDSLMADDTALAQRIRELRRAVDIDFLREDAPALINESIEGTERVQRIVQDLRDFSRLENPDWQGADLHAGLEATLNIVSNDVRFKADIVRELGDIPAVECLPFQINQVFLNILLNAAQSITGRGTITLRSGRVTDEVWISITDTGQGIPPERMARIFDPFYTTKPVGQGTGLGLSVSYGIVKKHGGRIDVQSQTGAGATFTIRLPIKRPAAA